MLQPETRRQGVPTFLISMLLAALVRDCTLHQMRRAHACQRACALHWPASAQHVATYGKRAFSIAELCSSGSYQNADYSVKPASAAKAQYGTASYGTPQGATGGGSTASSGGGSGGGGVSGGGGGGGGSGSADDAEPPRKAALLTAILAFIIISARCDRVAPVLRVTKLFRGSSAAVHTQARSHYKYEAPP